MTTELRTLYGASNRNIVRYHQAFFDNGAITIVMEYCDGGSLADVLRAMGKTRPGQPLPERFVAEIARQVSRGVRAWAREGLGGRSREVCGRAPQPLGAAVLERWSVAHLVACGALVTVGS